MISKLLLIGALLTTVTVQADPSEPEVAKPHDYMARFCSQTHWEDGTLDRLQCERPSDSQLYYDIEPCWKAIESSAAQTHKQVVRDQNGRYHLATYPAHAPMPVFETWMECVSEKAAAQASVEANKKPWTFTVTTNKYGTHQRANRFATQDECVKFLTYSLPPPNKEGRVCVQAPE
jgi:hypothetical protein